MPIPKKQNLQCPFCPATSSRGTGLSAHVRARHSKQYRNWNRNPNRFAEAAEAVVAPDAESERNNRPRLPTPTPIEQARTQSTGAEPQVSEPNGNEALNLLQQVHDQLAARKQNIETEMARVEALRSEHQNVITQLAAIDQAMIAFRGL